MVGTPSRPGSDARNAERFRVLLLPHFRAAYNYARWLTRDPVDAQDVVQEAMLQALRYFDSFQGEAARPWLFRIVRNVWSDFQRRHASEPLPMDMAETFVAAGPDPEQAALAGDRQRRVAAALRALPIEAREILVLRDIDDLSYRDIAAVLDVPVGTVMSRLARAREKLAAELKRRLERTEHGLSNL